MNSTKIIQGGMGLGVSDWRLARAVSLCDQLGVVSGTALDLIFVRRLQQGDPDGDMRRGLAAFPDAEMAQSILDQYFIPAGKKKDKPYASKAMVGHQPSLALQKLLVVANFVEVFLAKQGHDGLVGINFLHKIQTPIMPSLYGAMLAGVDVVIVGAGIPLQIPSIIDNLCRGEVAEFDLYVQGEEGSGGHKLIFDPAEVMGGACEALARPLFFPIVSSATLAMVMVKKCKGQVDGLIVEGPSAGGHNAPPRGKAVFNEEGEPVYGVRDEVNLEQIARLGLPFWLAGSYGKPEELQKALAAGAAGVQVGTIFAFCEESGLRGDIKSDVIKSCLQGRVQIKTDPVASPTGFPFKVISIAETLSEEEDYNKRKRMCDLGYLREAYELPDGSVGWRCRAEDPKNYVKSGGKLEDSVGKKCLCNGLMANIGLAQVRSDAYEELPLVTCGDDLEGIQRLSTMQDPCYTSADVIDFLLPVS
ncbi:MAG: nitronate monooxygenase [Verrucomicrobiales bacterium]|nr:nitronate monooxygenase [Verrucomicrobiales bacterium]